MPRRDISYDRYYPQSKKRHLFPLKIRYIISQSDILSKAVICSTRCIAAFSVAAFIKLEYVVGNSFEMKNMFRCKLRPVEEM